MTRFANLKKRDVAYRDVYIALKRELNDTQANGGDIAPVLEKLREADIDNRDVNIKLDKMRKKYGALPKVTLPCNCYTLSLTYPRDGMGRLHLRDNDDAHLYAPGCGYDKRGTVLGHWINKRLGDVLRDLNDIQLECLGYGINRMNGKTWVDGGCGEDLMIHMLNKFGFDVVTNYHRTRRSEYVSGWTITHTPSEV